MIDLSRIDKRLIDHHYRFTIAIGKSDLLYGNEGTEVLSENRVPDHPTNSSWKLFFPPTIPGSLQLTKEEDSKTRGRGLPRFVHGSSYRGWGATGSQKGAWDPTQLGFQDQLGGLLQHQL